MDVATKLDELSGEVDNESQTSFIYCEQDSPNYFPRPPHRAETWGVDDIRRHWVLRSHCEYVYFPNQYPSLALPSKLGRYLWQMQRAALKPVPPIIKEISRCANATLREIMLCGREVEELIICDSLLNLNWLDYAARKIYVDNLEIFISIQISLEMVSFENSQMKRFEGTRLLLALGSASANTLKRLYLWQMFARDENPVLIDTTYCQYRDKGAFKESATCKLSYWRSLIRFRTLTVLAINYGYLADTQGHTLCMLASILTGSLRELQLLCLENEHPNHRIANDFDGRFRIPNIMWIETLKYCPKLKVFMVFITLPLYEKVITFLTRSIPLSHFYLSSGIDLKFQQVWHIDCTLKTMFKWYGKTLEVLSLHLWRNREVLDSMLINAFEKFPRMTTLEFTGILYRRDTVRKICEKAKTGVYRIKKIRIRVQETPLIKDIEFDIVHTDREQIQERIQMVETRYGKIFEDIGIEVDLGTDPF